VGWETSRRRYRLPDNWNSIRLRVLAEDNWVCQIQFEGRCVGTASEVDHIVAGDDHSRSNLTSVCWKCHAKKSSMEGVAARRKKQRLGKRPQDRHPGQR
jgi:5-methylcytosine-specific restriction endonuclease McrA